MQSIWWLKLISLYCRWNRMYLPEAPENVFFKLKQHSTPNTDKKQIVEKLIHWKGKRISIPKKHLFMLMLTLSIWSGRNLTCEFTNLTLGLSENKKAVLLAGW